MSSTTPTPGFAPSSSVPAAGSRRPCDAAGGTAVNLFDSHAHFDHFATAEERAAACDRAAAAGVSRILAIGGSAAGNAAALETAGLRPAQVRACVGWDRGEAARAPDPEAVRAMLGDARVAAVGETGLDYHYDRDTAPA
ncbi:MAG: hypothetical protein FJ221_17735, partial [Lentisphaerae bacterium]|nr:hypothetical protein [Lentisphaerota bacterium]